MFKKLLALFGLEDRLVNELQLKLSATSAEIKDYCKANESRFSDYAKLIDKMKGESDSRLSRLEVLLASELAEKEKARDELITARRLKHGN
jgi:hypothetical protein